VKAIPTVYRGVEYRSRLEAKWSCLFDQIGWQHTYEPLDGSRYVPDFAIHGPAPLMIEVKPAITEADFDAPLDKVTLGLFEHWEHDVMVVGADPLPQLHGCCRRHPPAGLLGVFSDVPAEPVWMFDTGNWYSCAVCGGLAVCHRRRPFRGRPCGHVGDDNAGPVDVDIRGMWGEAANRVKWGGP
jgi:hypothetical protein